MKKIDKNSILYLIILIISISIAGIILYPLLDILYYKFITHSKFVYSVREHIIEPIIFGCIAGTVFWLVEKGK